MPKNISKLKTWIVILAVFLGIIAAAAIIGLVFSGISAFGDGGSLTSSSSSSSPLASDTPSSTNGRAEAYTDNLLLNPYYLRDLYHGTLLVLTEKNRKLDSCFGKCYNRFFICPESDQREECEENALILRDCPGPLLCIKECLEECNPKEIRYPDPGFDGVKCVDFRNAKAICP